MSDEDVIKNFGVGKFEADGSFQCSDQSKLEWFPPKGTKLKVDFKPGSKVEAKITLVLAPNTFFSGKKAIEEATYIVDVDNLKNAKPLDFQPSLKANEALEMKVDPKTGLRFMLHKVVFTDGVKGSWTCPDKS
jgi:hypothetical protein